MSRPKKRRTTSDLLPYLRDTERMAIQASTPAGRHELKQWRTSLTERLDEHQATVMGLQEALDLINAALGEVAA